MKDNVSVSVRSAVVNNGPDSSWSLHTGSLWLSKYWKNTTACLQHIPQMTQTGCHKTAETT